MRGAKPAIASGRRPAATEGSAAILTMPWRARRGRGYRPPRCRARAARAGRPAATRVPARSARRCGWCGRGGAPPAPPPGGGSARERRLRQVQERGRPVKLRRCATDTKARTWRRLRSITKRYPDDPIFSIVRSSPLRCDPAVINGARPERRTLGGSDAGPARPVHHRVVARGHSHQAPVAPRGADRDPVAAALVGGFGSGPASSCSPASRAWRRSSACSCSRSCFFGIVSDAGLLDPIIDRILATVGTRPSRIVPGTTLLALLIHLDGSGAVTFLITIPAMLPLYDRSGSTGASSPARPRSRRASTSCPGPGR